MAIDHELKNQISLLLHKIMPRVLPKLFGISTHIILANDLKKIDFFFFLRKISFEFPYKSHKQNYNYNRCIVYKIEIHI